ncbi:MAG: hypothetical protein E7649_06440 [Ruminococcaceae bacterium]|nr:hypothetical protein [Oscillospiraceae bacterium]
MSKTLSTVLTIFKVARIVAKVVFILCIVGAAGSLLGLITVPIASGVIPAELLGEQIIDVAASSIECTAGLITCLGEMFFAFFAERYFANVLKAGTPFTRDGAKECWRLGLASIIIAVATSVALGIASSVIMLLTQRISEFEADISLSTGLFFLFMSLIFKLGAEQQDPACEDTAQQETSARCEAQD